MTDVELFDFSVNLLRPLLWQYEQAPNLRSLITQKQAWWTTNHQLFWENWVRDVFDLRTANEFGLSVWAIILNLPLSFDTPPSTSQPVFGFGPYAKNFNRGNFSSRGGNTVILTTDQKRLALRLRYFQLVTSGAVPEVNRFLAYLFGPGVVYLLDGNNMTQTYVFSMLPDAGTRYLLDNYDLLPRPATVKSRYIVGGQKAFGFGPYELNFNRGNFGN